MGQLIKFLLKQDTKKLISIMFGNQVGKGECLIMENKQLVRINMNVCDDKERVIHRWNMNMHFQ